jgi:transcriptional regulator with XRE-family HTH domain
MYYIICQALKIPYHYVLGNQMTQPREIFAKNLKEKRRISGLTQAKLAEKVNVSTHHIAMIELARNFPTSELMGRIASVLGLKIHELFIENNSINFEFEQLRQEIKSDTKQLLDEYLEKMMI